MSFLGLGGGGGDGAKTISPSQEYSKMINIFTKQAYPAYQKWLGGQPLLQSAIGLANQNLANLPGYQTGLTSGYQTAQQAIPGLTNMIRNAYGSATPTSVLKNPLLGTYSGYLSNIVGNQGALTGGLARAATQEALQASAGAGMAHTNQAIALDLLNREKYRDARYQAALQNMLGIGNQITGIDTEALQRAQGAAGSLYGLSQAPMQNALSYATGMQNLGQQTAQQLYGAEMGPIGAWQGLFNPVGQNVADVLNYNLNAQNSAANANANKNAALLGSVIKAAGNVAGSYI